jgi:imidazolonepropionase-like amidohydrolase
MTHPIPIVRGGNLTLLKRTLSQLLPGIFVCLLTAGCSNPQKRDARIAITHANVIDATGSPIQRNMTVVVEGQKIAQIAESAQVALDRETLVIDASGKFLIPGLVDSHVHLTGSGEPNGSREFIVPLLVAHGITTVRDMGGYLESLKPLRDDIKRGKRVGPEIFFAGPYLDGSPPSFEPSLVVTNATQAAEDVRTLVQQGVDFIKVQSILGRDAYFAIAAAAKREKIAFVGHVPDRVVAAEASDARQKSIEHLTGVLRACASDEARLMREQMRAPPKGATPSESHAREFAWQRQLLATQSEPKTAKLIATFVRNATWQTPTLILLREDAFPSVQARSATEDSLKFVPRSIVQKWKQAAEAQDKFASPAEFALREKLFARSLEVVEQMEKASVPILAGTDTAAPYVVPGVGLHVELGLLVQAGLTPLQALQAATKRPAEFLGKSEAQGTIERGKFADLVVLDGNPLDNIGNIGRIRAVLVRGKLLDRRMLDDMLSAVEAYASAN